MNIFRNYIRYRKLRNKGISRLVAAREFSHQKLTIGDALFLTLTPMLILTSILYLKAQLAHHSEQQAIRSLQTQSQTLFQTEARLADVLSGRYIKLDGVHTRYGRCNAADGCPEDRRM